MRTYERIALTEVDGSVFARGFLAFVLVFTIILLIGNWWRKKQAHLDAPLKDNEADFFDKIEEFQNDFK